MKDLINFSYEAMERNLTNQKKETRANELNKKSKLRDEESKQIENGYFDILKNLTILAGTIFGSSIALSVGKQLNSIFIVGELLLLIAVFSGVIDLWTRLKGKEWFYFLMVKSDLELDLILYKDVMEDFEKENTEKSIVSYKKLLEQKGLLYRFLKIVPIDIFPTLFFLSLLTGLILILLSFR